MFFFLELGADLVDAVIAFGEGDFEGIHLCFGEAFFLPDSKDSLGLSDLFFHPVYVLDEGFGTFIHELPHDDFFEFRDGDWILPWLFVGVQ